MEMAGDVNVRGFDQFIKDLEAYDQAVEMNYTSAGGNNYKIAYRQSDKAA